MVGTRPNRTSTSRENGSEANGPGQTDHRTRDERDARPLRRAEERKSEEQAVSACEEREGRRQPRLQGAGRPRGPSQGANYTRQQPGRRDPEGP